MENKNKLQGLGGWLIVLSTEFIFRFTNLLADSTDMFAIFEDGTWEALTTEGSEAYHALWAPLLIGEIVYNACMIAVHIYLLYLFFSKHYLFPRVFIGFLAVSLIFFLFGAWLVSIVLPNQSMLDRENMIKFAYILIFSGIWVPYLLISKRVKATFVKAMPNKSTRQTGFASS